MSDLKDLPFDQYSRQKLVADFIDELRQTNQKFTILDVGGYKGQTQRFSKSDKVTILDVFDAKESNYIKGDGTNLKLKDQSYDFVVSFDALEHIPKNKRAAFIKECSRVAKQGFFLCCPYENGTGRATQAEKSLNSIYATIQKADHQWLNEHIQNGLPTQAEIEKAAKAAGKSFCNTYSNRLDNWLSLQTLFFLSDALDVVSMDAGKLNRQYTDNVYAMEAEADQDNAYRVIYFISSDKSAVAKVQKSMAALKQKPIKPGADVLYKLPAGVAEITERKVKTQHDQMQHAINLLSEQLAEKERLITAMRKSASWQLTKPLRAPKYLKDRNKK